MTTTIATRPKAHFTPPNGWLNDPNGLVYFEGEYHLFYQYHPASLVWGPMHWGHAVSKDLKRWEHLEIALVPDELGTCFSGSAVVDKANTTGLFPHKPGLVAVYTCHRDEPDFDRGYVEEQCIAYSHDNGRSWIKYAQNPVVRTNGKSDFRDPKVFWHDASQSWIMLLAVGQEIQLYRSHNLLEWEFCSRFGEGQGAHSAHPWECPDLIEITIDDSSETRWVLIVGLGASEESFGSFTQYFVGHFNGREFVNENAPDEVRLMDEGRDFYAVQSWSNTPNSDVLAIAWMSNWKYANQFPATDYRGSMSLVRSLKLTRRTSGLLLTQQFADYSEPKNNLREPVNIDPIWQAEGVDGPRIGHIELNLETGSSVELSFFERNSADLRLTAQNRGYTIEIIRKDMSDDDHFNKLFGHTYSRHLKSDGPLQIDWSTDLKSLEILLDGGLMSITQLVNYSRAGAPVQLRLSAGRCKLLEHGEYVL